jgi:hypothetical protein
VLTSLLRLSAFVAVVSVVGAESARRTTQQDGRQAAVFPPWPVSLEGPAIFDIGVIATAAPDSLLGAEVVAEHVCVREVTGHGFWVTPVHDDAHAFVHPAEGPLIKVRVGESVTIHGEVRLTTNPMEQRTADQWPGHAISRPMPYVYAYTVRPAWPRDSAPPARSRTSACASFDQGG